MISMAFSRTILSLVLVLSLASTARGEIDFSESQIDLGVLRTGHLLKFRFTYTNHGSTVAEITEVKAGCGCMKSECTLKKLAPGQEGTLLITMNTLSASPGRQAWKVALHYQTDGKRAEATLLLHAHILQEILVQPPQIKITSEGGTEHEIVVLDQRQPPMRVLKVETTSSHIVARLQEAKPNSSKQQVGHILCQVSTGLPVGRHAEHVIIHTDDPIYRELRVDIEVLKKGKQPFAALPDKVLLIASPSQPAPSKLITIRPNHGNMVSIAKAEADHPAVTCRWSQSPASVGTVKIIVDRTKLTGSLLSAQVRVTFHDADDTFLLIPIACEVR